MAPVTHRVRTRKAADPMKGYTVVMVCSNRCLYCGRLTTHEVCHAHGAGYWKKLDPFRRVGGALLGIVHVRGRSPMRLPERPKETEADWQRRWQRASNRLWRHHANREPEVCTDITCPQAQRDWR
jgi:hypothetical protein